MALLKVYYKGKEIPMNNIKVDWTDCFGELHSGSIEDYASDYAAEEVATTEALHLSISNIANRLSRLAIDCRSLL